MAFMLSPHVPGVRLHDEFDGCPIALVSAAIRLIDYNVDTFGKTKQKLTRNQILCTLSLLAACRRLLTMFGQKSLKVI